MSIEVIIPAYNEARTIAGVVRTARACALVSRVIVVDDGSKDQTAAVAREAGAEVYSLTPNQGKTAALLRGLEASQALVLVLLDGDLLGLETGHIEALAEPVLASRAAMTVGVFHDGRWITDLSQSLTPFLNGQRGLRRELLGGLSRGTSGRYAADTLLSLYARRSGAKVLHIRLTGLTHVMKEEKVGWRRGLTARLLMFWQVFTALFIPFPPENKAAGKAQRTTNKT